MNLTQNTGLSILLPIYNFDCRALIQDLHQQCKALGFPFEIICLDDASEASFRLLNQSVKSRNSSIKYQYLEQNVGRSRIRNLLAQKAQFEYLLFLDCDSKIVNADYIKQYITYLNPQKLLYGGRVYQASKPENKEWILHWKFGRQREESSATARNQKPYHSFMTNNFVVPKSIFQQIQFDESLKQYGHEDTLFGLELEARQISILHLDNPLEHIGLETTEIFLEKTNRAIENLAQLHLQGKPVETRLLGAFLKLRKYRLSKVFLSFYPIVKPWIKRNLYAACPNLLCLDFYKLNCLVKRMRMYE
ncbi:MAG: glycosyltransferase [Bacteroidota bacterium]